MSKFRAKLTTKQLSAYYHNYRLAAKHFNLQKG